MNKHLLSLSILIAIAMSLLSVSAKAQFTYNTLDGTEGFFSGEEGEEVEEACYNLFDGDVSTKWCCEFDDEAFVEFTTSRAIRVAGYVITTANDSQKESGRNPDCWMLLASDDNDNWDTIHTVVNDTVIKAANFTSYTFRMSQTAKQYQFFRWVITEIEGGNILQASEFSLIEGTVDPASVFSLESDTIDNYLLGIYDTDGNAITTAHPGDTIVVQPVSCGQNLGRYDKWTCQQPVTRLANGFIMPASDVVLTPVVLFPRSITVNANAGGTVQVFNEDGDEVNSLYDNELYSILITPDGEHYIRSLDINGQLFPYSDNQYHRVANQDIVITVVFGNLSDYKAISVADVDNGHLELYDWEGYGCISLLPGSIFFWSSFPDDGYYLDSLHFSVSVSQDDEGNYLMPDSDLIITPYFSEIPVPEREDVFTLTGVTVSFGKATAYPWAVTTEEATYFDGYYMPGLMSTNFDEDDTESRDTIFFASDYDFTLSFDYAVSSESGFDELNIWLDDRLIVEEATGEEFDSFSRVLGGGKHMLVVSYGKDGSHYDGLDRAFIYNISAVADTTGEPTALDAASDDALRAEKIVRDGHVYIFRSGATYDALGRMVE